MDSANRSQGTGRPNASAEAHDQPLPRKRPERPGSMTVGGGVTQAPAVVSEIASAAAPCRVGKHLPARRSLGNRRPGTPRPLENARNRAVWV